jgi:hypothetical protein
MGGTAGKTAGRAMAKRLSSDTNDLMQQNKAENADAATAGYLYICSSWYAKSLFAVASAHNLLIYPVQLH